MALVRHAVDLQGQRSLSSPVGELPTRWFTFVIVNRLSSISWGSPRPWLQRPREPDRICSRQPSGGEDKDIKEVKILGATRHPRPKVRPGHQVFSLSFWFSEPTASVHALQRTRKEERERRKRAMKAHKGLRPLTVCCHRPWSPTHPCGFLTLLFGG